MELHKITEDLTVAGQLDAAGVPLIAAQGFRSIVCNRPDGEAMGQPAFGQVEQAARAAGMTVVYQPVPSNAVSDADGAALESCWRSYRSRCSPIAGRVRAARFCGH